MRLGGGERRRSLLLLRLLSRSQSVAEQPEVLGIRPDHQRGTLVQGRAERFERAIEVEELPIPAVGLVEDLGLQAFALTAQRLGGALGIGQDQRALAIGLGLDLGFQLLAFGAQLGGLGVRDERMRL